MRILISILLICATGLAMVPPMPPIPKARVRHKPAAVERGAGAKALIAKPKTVARAAASSLISTNIVVTYQRALKWDIVTDAQNPASNLVFIVRSSSDLRTPASRWPVAGIAQGNLWPFTINTNAPAKWFFVQTSNTVDHTVSLP